MKYLLFALAYLAGLYLIWLTRPRHIIRERIKADPFRAYRRQIGRQEDVSSDD